MTGSDLLADHPKPAVFPHTLVGLPQHRVEGLVAVPEDRRSIPRDGEGSHVDLQEVDQLRQMTSHETHHIT